MTRQTFFKIFDIKIQPILMYASEIWRTVRLDGIKKGAHDGLLTFFRSFSENTEQDGVR